MKFFPCSILLICLMSSAFALQSKDCRCKGQSSRRIIGGNRTLHWPWHLSLGWKSSKVNGVSVPEAIKRHHCGAIILNEQWALTSGFCVFDLESKTPLKPEEIDIGYGSNDLAEIVHQKKLVDVDQIVPHPNFNLTPEANLALLKLKTPFNFDGEIVSPACLEMDHPRKFYTEQLFGFGFGVTDVFLNSMNTAYLYGNNSRFLKESLLQDQSGKLDLCHDKDLDETICLKGEGKFCRGDEGSPLQKHANGKATVLGLASHFKQQWVTIGTGFGADHALHPCWGPTAYMHLAAPRFINWIKETVDEICS